MIENGGHGGTAAAPAALKVFQQYFAVKAASPTLRSHRTDGRLRRTTRLRASGAAGRGRGRGRLRAAASTGCCSPRSAALVGFGLWAIAGITRHDVAGDPSYYLVRQGIFALLGAVGLVGALFVDPDLYRRHRRSIYGLHDRRAARRHRRWERTRAARSAGSTSASSASSRPSSGSCCSSSSSPASSPTGRSGSASGGRRPPPSGSRPFPIAARLHPAGHRHCARLLARSSRRRCSSPATRWRTWRCSARSPRSSSAAVLWFAARRLGVHVLKPYQQARLTAFLDPDHDPAAARPTTSTSRRSRSARAARPAGASRARRRRISTTCPSTRTDFAFASLAEQRGFVGASLLLGLYLLVVWRGLRDRRRRARRVLGDRRRRRSSSPSSSRSSSTSA